MPMVYTAGGGGYLLMSLLGDYLSSYVDVAIPPRPNERALLLAGMLAGTACLTTGVARYPTPISSPLSQCLSRIHTKA